jgi:hypothetical protein
MVAGPKAKCIVAKNLLRSEALGWLRQFSILES